MFRSFRKNRNFSKILTKIQFFRKFDSQISLISKVFVIFKNFDQNRIFFENLTKFKFLEIIEKNRIFRKISPKSILLLKIWLKSKIFEIFEKIEIFRKFDQNRYFSKILSKWKFFEKLTKMAIFLEFFEMFEKSEIFRKFWPKSKSFGNLTEIEIFRNFRKNGNFS